MNTENKNKNKQKKNQKAEWNEGVKKEENRNSDTLHSQQLQQLCTYALIVIY